MPTIARDSGKPQSRRRPHREPWRLPQEGECRQREAASKPITAALPKLPVLPSHLGELLRNTNSWMVSPGILVPWVWNRARVVLKGGQVYRPQTTDGYPLPSYATTKTWRNKPH